MSTTKKAYPSIESLKTFVFEGIDGEECEDLIHAVRLQAREANQMGDNVYMARWASACMVGNALRWYVALPKEIKYDWEELEQALMAEHPINDESRMSRLKPRPTDIRRGRIKVICDNPSRGGYVSPAKSGSVDYLSVTQSASDALHVQYDPDPSGGASKMKLLNQGLVDGKQFDSLGVVSSDSQIPLGQGSHSFGLMTIAKTSGNGIVPRSTGRKGDQRFDIWSVTSDGSILIHWYYGGKNHDLVAAVRSEKSFTIYVMNPSDQGAFNAKYPSYKTDIASLVLEAFE